MHHKRWVKHGDPNHPGRGMKPKPQCQITGCDSPVYGHGWCNTHYARWYRHGDAEDPGAQVYGSLADRLMHYTPARVGDLCQLWTGTIDNNGYGKVTVDGRLASGRVTGAHRATWAQAYGPIPKGQHVCHHCDTPPCVRLDHLFLGTDAENMADMTSKGRRAGRPCRKLTPDEVHWARSAAATGVTYRTIARSLGIVDEGTIGDIIHWRTWKYI